MSSLSQGLALQFYLHYLNQSALTGLNARTKVWQRHLRRFHTSPPDQLVSHLLLLSATSVRTEQLQSLVPLCQSSPHVLSLSSNRVDCFQLDYRHIHITLIPSQTVVHITQRKSQSLHDLHHRPLLGVDRTTIHTSKYIYAILGLRTNLHHSSPPSRVEHLRWGNKEVHPKRFRVEKSFHAPTPATITG